MVPSNHHNGSRLRHTSPEPATQHTSCGCVGAGYHTCWQSAETSLGYPACFHSAYNGRHGGYVHPLLYDRQSWWNLCGVHTRHHVLCCVLHSVLGLAVVVLDWHDWNCVHIGLSIMCWPSWWVSSPQSWCCSSAYTQRVLANTVGLE